MNRKGIVKNNKFIAFYCTLFLGGNVEDKYNEELLSIGFATEVLDGTKVERSFFTITEDDLKNVFNVLPSDSLNEAKKKINEVISKDDFLYKYFHKDPLIWEIKEYTPGYWTVPVKEEKILNKEDLDKMGYTDSEIKKMRLPIKNVEVKNTIQQKLTIKFTKRKLENVMSDESLKAFYEKYDSEFRDFLANENILSILLKQKLEPVKKNINTKYDYDKLLVIPDVELHIGKLASKFDSTDSYDYKKALYRYIKIILEAEKVEQMYKTHDVCMTIGNDFYNTDTEQNTTTAGTEQHNDTRFQQMIATGIVAHIWAIERLKKSCGKLILKYNPGNHDYLTDYTLFMQLYMLYKDDPKVEIECRVKDSRFATSLSWKKNLVIFAHGKTPEGKAISDDNLSLLRDTMFKEEAKSATYCTVLAGHLHNATENNFSKKKKYTNGVTVIRSGSPSGDGAWESENLYSSDKSHQIYVFDANRGLNSTVNVTLTKEELERGISVPQITDDTNYLKTIQKSVEISSNDILVEDFKKIIQENKKAIKEIKKKYETKLNEILSSLNIQNITEEKKQEILMALGYQDEIKPYLENQEKLSSQMVLKLKK